MKIQRILLYLLLLPVFSCEHIDDPELVPEERESISFSLDTKGLPSGERTYRVVLSNEGDQCVGNGTYCNTIITPGTMGSWLAPCQVNELGEPLKEDGTTVASNLSEANINGKFGLRFTSNMNPTVCYLSAASPAIGLKTENNKSYFSWNSETPLFISGLESLKFFGSWVHNQYIYDPTQSEALTMKEQRAKFSVHIECGELDHADIQAVTLTHINKARWYLTSGISTNASHYSKTLEALYEGSIIHLDKSGSSADEREWNSAQTYILPFDYSLEAVTAMQPEVVILLGNTDTPGKASVKIAEQIEPMKNYVLDLTVSKQYIHCTLTAEDWYNGGTIETIVEQWAKIVFDGSSQWDKLDDDINSDESWNDQL